MKRLFLLVLSIYFGIYCWAADFVVDEISYNVISKTSPKTVEVTKSKNAYSGDVIIPSTINVNGELYNVIAIGKNAFKNCNNLTSVSLPNSVLHLANYAFSNCSKLEYVNIPNSIKSIGRDCFLNNRKLTIIIDDKLPECITPEIISQISGISVPYFDYYRYRYDEITSRFNTRFNMYPYYKFLNVNDGDITSNFIQYSNNLIKLVDWIDKTGSNDIYLPDKINRFKYQYKVLKHINSHYQIVDWASQITHAYKHEKSVLERNDSAEVEIIGIHPIFYQNTEFKSIHVSNKIVENVMNQIPNDVDIHLYPKNSSHQHIEVKNDIVGNLTFSKENWDITSLKIKGVINNLDLDRIFLTLKFLSVLDLSDCEITNSKNNTKSLKYENYENAEKIENIHLTEYIDAFTQSDNYGRVSIDNSVAYNLRTIISGKNLAFLKYYPLKNIENLTIPIDCYNIPNKEYIKMKNLKSIFIKNDSSTYILGKVENLDLYEDCDISKINSSTLCYDLTKCMKLQKKFQFYNETHDYKDIIYQSDLYFVGDKFYKLNLKDRDLPDELYHQLYFLSSSEIKNKLNAKNLNETDILEKCSYGIRSYDKYPSILNKDFWSYYATEFSEYDTPLKKDYFIKSEKFKSYQSDFNRILNQFNNTIFYSILKPIKMEYNLNNKTMVFTLIENYCGSKHDKNVCARPQKCIKFTQDEFIYISNLPLTINEKYCNSESSFRHGVSQLHIPMDKDLAFHFENTKIKIYMVFTDKITSDTYNKTNLKYWFGKEDKDFKEYFIDDYFNEETYYDSRHKKHPVEFLTTSSATMLIFDESGKLLLQKKW